MEEDVLARIEALESHVARLEGIIHVLLEEIETGTIEQSAGQIRAALPKLEE